MTKKLFVSLMIIGAIFIGNPTIYAADAPAPVAKLKIEKLFPENVSLKALFDVAVEVLTEKGLSKHPLKNMKAKLKEKKGKGKIKTPVYRYFKIYSARPVVENHYRDSYVLKFKVIETEKALPVEPEVAKEGEATAAVDAAKNAGTEGEIAGAAPEAPPAPPVEIIKNVKLSMVRKFQIHNDATRKWDKADPVEHPVGYTVVNLMDAIEKRLADGDSAEKVEQVNLNINPPVFVQ